MFVGNLNLKGKLFILFRMKISHIVSVVAMTLLLAACSKEPTSLEDLRAAGKKAYLNQKYAEARTYFNKALKISSVDADILYFNGLSYKRDYIYDSALRFIKRADLAKPDNLEINREIYDLAQKTENWDYALSAVRVLIFNGEPEQKYHKDLAKFSIMSGQPLEALWWQSKVMEVDSSAGEYEKLVTIYLSMDSLNEALDKIKIMRTKFGDSDQLKASEGTIFVSQKKYAEAENIFRTLLAKDSAQLGYKLNLANTLSFSPDKIKKREALSLFKALPPDFAKKYNVDSLIHVIDSQLVK
jgi:tetratricopeptide (TPR) repeat protein